MKVFAKMALLALVPTLTCCVHGPSAGNAGAPHGGGSATVGTNPTPSNIVDVSIVIEGDPKICTQDWHFAKMKTSTGPGQKHISVRDRGEIDLTALQSAEIIQFNFKLQKPHHYWFPVGTGNNLAISLPPTPVDYTFTAPLPSKFTLASKSVSSDQKTLTFFDTSDDNKAYTYALQYYNADRVRCSIDPEIKNGGPGTGGMEDDTGGGKK